MFNDRLQKAMEECEWCKNTHAKNSAIPNCNNCINRFITEAGEKETMTTITMKPEEIHMKIGRHNAKEQLTLNEYQTLANVTRNKDITDKESLTNYGLGLTGEAGEVADIIKKGIFHGHKIDRNELIKELGDVMWYVASLASTIDVSLEQIACMNIDKLRKRYPEGFDQSKSINRVENKTSTDVLSDRLYTAMSISNGHYK